MDSDVQAPPSGQVAEPMAAARPAAPEASLPDLRARLDAIDDALHDLLMRRAAIVAEVAVVKTGATLRPGREAAIIRRLLGRNAAPLAPSAVVRVWRSILAASSAQQSGLSVAVCDPAADGRYAGVAREHFGALAPLRLSRSPAQAIGEVLEGRASVAVLPPPAEAADGTPWWPGLLQQHQTGRIHLVARLPFWQSRPEGTPQTQAVVVARVPADPSGQDISLIAFETSGNVSRGALGTALAAAGLQPITILQHQRDRHAPAQFLIEVAGYVEAGDPRLSAIRGLDRPAFLVGAYAVPVAGVQP